MTSEKDEKPGKREVTMTAGEANLYSLVFLVPLLMIIGVPYYYLWPEQFSKTSIRTYLDAREMMSFADIFIGLLIIFGGVIIHELLHGIAWSFYTKNGWRSISFGIVWKYLTPYCHCSEPLLMRSYQFGSALPAVALGFIPSTIALITGNIWLMLFGFFFTFAAGGDFLILWLLRKEKSANMVQDHPDKIGCIIIEDK